MAALALHLTTSHYIHTKCCRPSLFSPLGRPNFGFFFLHASTLPAPRSVRYPSARYNTYNHTKFQIGRFPSSFSLGSRTSAGRRIEDEGAPDVSRCSMLGVRCWMFPQENKNGAVPHETAPFTQNVCWLLPLARSPPWIAHQLPFLLVPQAERQRLHAACQRDRLHLLEERLRFMALLQIVVRDA